MLPQGQKALLTICLEELVSASFVNCAKQFNKKVHFIQVLKYLVFMHPRDKSIKGDGHDNALDEKLWDCCIDLYAFLPTFKRHRLYLLICSYSAW
jgi:hypothetical protein